MRSKNDLLSSGAVPDLALLEDETLIWAGRPRYGLQFHRIDIWLIPACLILFSLPIIAMSILANASLHPIIYLILSPFFAVSLFTPFARILFDAWRRKRTIYAITDQRVVIQTTLSKKSVTSHNVHKINRPKLEINKDKSGSILFGKEDPCSYHFRGNKIDTKTERLECIDDVETVYQTLMGVRK